MEKAYNSKKYEEKIYQAWEKSGYFNPDNLPGDRSEKFSMVLPPPNVTGMLHMGHAFESTLQDIVVRFERMRGKKTLWVPGTDHAAIATQAKVENEIYEKEGKTRYDLGREEFLKRVEQFAKSSHDSIIDQLKEIGASLDWSREAYTLDETRSRAVRTAFKRMYDDGLIYRGQRVVNWDPKGQTTVSDDEVVYKETAGKLYIFKYAKDFPITIATTRPETKLGDTAVAVHPDDKRYKKYIGKTYGVNFAGVDLDIQIIADEAIDSEFGTGAVGVTPAHSIVDWEIAQRHDLPLKQVIDEQARIINTKTPLDGKIIAEARKELLVWLKENKLLENIEDIPHSIATAERTGGIIEPLPKLQWFINVNAKFKLQNSKLEGIPADTELTLKDLMRKVVETGQIKIVPERFEKVYFHWINDLRDWNISRQIWFGHRVPVWYREKEEYVDLEPPKDKGWQQDPDTLDTWFSSALWTFSTLGWPDETEDFQKYHPTDLMNPGYEILFFWVARMILMSGFLLGEIPFHTVLLHGIVRDSQGRKFSKSENVGSDPLEIIKSHGTDALRMALITGVSPGNDTIFDMEKVKAYKHFANKIWNVSRFVLMNLEEFDPSGKPSILDDDSKHLTELKALVKDITSDMETFRFHLASEKLYHYFWHAFADKIIEGAKPRLSGEDEQDRRAAQALLFEMLTTLLKLLHPFMPFVTEVIWSKLPLEEKNLLIVEAWPVSPSASQGGPTP